MGDLISRQAALKNAHFPMIDDAGYEVVRVDDILALPSAEPKTGKWIWKNKHIKRTRQVKGLTANDEETVVSVHEDYIEQRPYCSECGKWNDSDHLRYCPNCGVRMLGEDGEEDDKARVANRMAKSVLPNVCEQR